MGAEAEATDFPWLPPGRVVELPGRGRTFIREVGPWNFEVGDLSRQLATDYDDLVNGRLPNR